jgi:capsular polysaccharide biosynthesis protein
MSIISRLLRIYRNYLARFIVFRLLKALAMGAYRSAFSFFSLLARHPRSGTYRFRPLSDCDGRLSPRKITLDRGGVIEIPPPTFSGHCADIASKKNTVVKIDTPRLDVFEFSRAMAVGGVDFVFVSDTAIHHDLFMPSQHHCPAEYFGVVSINRQKGSLKLRLTQECKKIPMAATMIGQCSGNYAHWLTETLPKLPVFDACGDFADLPLLVDDGLSPNIYASIDLVNGNRRKVIAVKRWEPVVLDKLVTVSHPGYERYVPHGIHNREAPAYVNTFSPTALRMLRDTVGNALEGSPQLRAKKIYLSRSEKSGNLRQIDNLSAVEAAIRDCGIQLIRPESMEFKEQVAACMNAELIVAPVGAALANMIFAPPGCGVIVLSPYYDEANYFYYSNLAGVLGHELRYVLGPQTRENKHPAHKSYHIDVEVLMATLEQVTNRAHED